jgi:hypothetical protein
MVPKETFLLGLKPIVIWLKTYGLDSNNNVDL